MGGYKQWKLRVGFIPPFPRLRYRLRFGVWCPHEPFWSDWYLIDVGRRKRRDCLECDYAELS